MGQPTSIKKIAGRVVWASQSARIIMIEAPAKNEKLLIVDQDSKMVHTSDRDAALIEIQQGMAITAYVDDQAQDGAVIDCLMILSEPD